MPDSKVKLKDKNVQVTRGRYLPKSKHTVWPADPLIHVLLLSLKLEYYGEKKGTVPLFLSLSRDPPQWNSYQNSSLFRNEKILSRGVFCVMLGSIVGENSHIHSFFDYQITTTVSIDKT